MHDTTERTSLDSPRSEGAWQPSASRDRSSIARTAATHESRFGLAAPGMVMVLTLLAALAGGCGSSSGGGTSAVGGTTGAAGAQSRGGAGGSARGGSAGGGSSGTAGAGGSPSAGAGAGGSAGVAGTGVSPAGGAGAGGSAGLNGAGGAGGATVVVCSCPMATDGCLIVRVLRGADESKLPWTIWPAEADGTGTLIAAATAGSTSYRKMSPAPVDMTSATAGRVLDLGCVAAASTIQVFAFLDDNGNATATATSSADYRDACGNPRSVTVPVLAGKNTLVDFPLAGSCD
jgi:hypothetical protein